MNAAGGLSEEPDQCAPFPWGAAIAFGLARLRLPPAQFWQLTPRELMAMAGAQHTNPGLPRDALERLMADCPDEEGSWTRMDR